MAVSIHDLVRKNCSDVDLERAVSNNLPKKTYLSIQMFSCNKSFYGYGERKARVIVLQPTGNCVDELIQKLQKLFIGLHPPDDLFRKSLISHHILGIEQTEESEKEIRRVCNDKREIRIFISVDLEFFFCEIEEDRSGIFGYCSIQ